MPKVRIRIVTKGPKSPTTLAPKGPGTPVIVVTKGPATPTNGLLMAGDEYRVRFDRQ